MKETPEELELKRMNFLPGKITREGFLGTDRRHIHDIIASDVLYLSRRGITCQQIGARLQFFIDEGKKGLENDVEVENYIVKLQWARGMLPCPFGDRTMHHKIFVTLTNKDLDESIKFSQLNIHLIKEHCFFVGRGCSFRLEPEYLIPFLGLE